MFWKRKKRVMDPNSAHLISFALDVSKDEVDGLIRVAEKSGLNSVTERLRRHHEALAKIHAEFLVTSENLEELADQTDAIATDIAEIEQLMEIDENNLSIHCALATASLSAEAMIARGGHKA